MLDSADPRGEAQAQHGEGGEVDLGIAVGVGIMLFDLGIQKALRATARGGFLARVEPLRVGLYARISTHDQQTLPLQVKAMRQYARRRN